MTSVGHVPTRANLERRTYKIPGALSKETKDFGRTDAGYNEWGPLGRVPHRRSLNGTGLTREGWCCVGRWLSRMDMTTYQRSIKNSTRYIIDVPR